MEEETFHLKFYAHEQKSTIVDFPITIKEIPPGRQVERGWHKHDSLELVLVTGGSGLHFLEGKSAAIRTGDVLVVYPNLLHGYANCGSLGLINIMYDSSKLPIPVLDGTTISLFSKFLPENLMEASKQGIPAPLMHFPTAEAMAKTLTEIQELVDELTTLRPGNMLASTIKFLDIILSILRHADSASRDKEPDDPVFLWGNILKFLNQNYTRRISLDSLVRLSWLSPRVFQSKFKEQTGYSVSEYIARKRLAHAQELLLKNPERNIQEIALDSGYCDASDFSYKFRLRTGMTPREYRRRHLEKG